MKRLARLFVAALALVPALAYGQGAVLQGGGFTPGHVPQYVGSGNQAVIQDGGTAAGGQAGVNPSEFALTARGTGTAPYSAQGSGPNGTISCLYDAPITNPTGYHYFCMSPNGQGGQALISIGPGGTASPLPMTMILNGTSYAFPGAFSGLTIGVTGITGATTGNCLYVNGVVLGQQPCAQNIAVGSTVIGSGTPNGLLYDNAGVLGNLATANSGVLVTSAGGLPSISTTLPSALAMGTPASIVLTNGTGLPVATGISGLGSGVATALGVNIGSAGAPVLFNGAGGTPSSITLTNGTGLPISGGITGLGANVATFLATPSSANLRAALTDETGTGAAVFANTPSLVTPSIDAATGVSLALGGCSLSGVFCANGNGFFSGFLDVVSSSANAFAVGQSGASNPAFNVDTSTSSQATGLNIKGAAAGGGLAVSVVSSGSNENLGVDAKGSGTITLGAVSTGNILLTRPTGVLAATDGSGVRIGGTINTGSLGGLKVGTTWTGAITNIAGIFNEPTFDASANINTYYGLSLNGPAITAGGAVANLYGLRIGLQTGATTINQAIYTQGNQKVGFGTSNAQAHFHINENTVQNITPPSGTLLFFSAADNSAAQAVYDSYGNSSAISQLIFRRAEGTAASPTAVQSGDTLGNLVSEGHDGTSYSAATAAVAFVACANWTNGPSHCTDVVLSTTASGGNFASETLRVLGAGNVKFTNAANFSANASVATSLGSVGPVGSHTTVQKWLTVVDNTGATLYIPAF